MTTTSTTDRGRWKVQVGTNKGSYTTKHDFHATESIRAENWYDQVNVHSGGKKRLIDPNGNVKLREIT